MSRLPIVATDLDAWGDILNDFLLQSHNADGTLKISDGSYLATTTPVLKARVTGDVNPRFELDTDGRHQWGPGNAALDANLYRSSVNNLKTDGSFTAVGSINSQAGASFTRASAPSTIFNISVVGDAVNRLLVTADGKHTWGDGTNPADVNLYRSAAGILQTDQILKAAGGFSAPGLPLTTTQAFGANVVGDTAARFTIGADGKMGWSAGTGAPDTDLSRAAAGLLKSTSVVAGASFQASTSATVIAGSGQFTTVTGAASRAFRTLLLAGDTVEAFSILGDGTQRWGAGGSSSVDVTLARVSAGQLQINNRLSITNASNATAYSSVLTGDTNSRFTIDHSGGMSWGPGNAVTDTVFYRAAVGVLQLGGSTAAGGLRAFGSTTASMLYSGRVTTDTFDRINIGADGKLSWGPGNAAADTTISRAGALLIQTESEFRVLKSSGSTAFGAIQSADLHERWNVQTTGLTQWGDGTNNIDTNLYRASAATLRTDGKLQVGTNFTVIAGSGANFVSISGTLTDTAVGAVAGMNVTATVNPITASSAEFRSLNMSATVGGNTVDYSSVIKGGHIEGRWTGTGNVTGIIEGLLGQVVIPANATSFGTITNAIGVEALGLQEFATAAIVGTVTTATSLRASTISRSNITVVNAIGIDALAQTQATTLNIGVRIAKSNTYSLQLSDTGGTAAGGITFGTDTNIYRSAANILKTDDLFDSTTLGLATKVKAGAPVDGDWAVAPPVGTIVFDTTNSKIWVRTAAATWKGVVVA